MKLTMKLLVLLFSVLMLVNVANAEPSNSHPKQSDTQVSAQPAPSPSPFTEIQLKKINQYWDTRGKEFNVSRKLSRLLGLTKNDEIISAIRISGKDENKIFHLFARIKNENCYILSREPNPDEVHMYWIGPDCKVIAALADSKDNGTAILAVQDAEKELQSEYAVWAKVADKLKAE